MSLFIFGEILNFYQLKAEPIFNFYHQDLKMDYKLTHNVIINNDLSFFTKSTIQCTLNAVLGRGVKASTSHRI